jgi:hypothetical protein
MRVAHHASASILNWPQALIDRAEASRDRADLSRASAVAQVAGELSRAITDAMNHRAALVPGISRVPTANGTVMVTTMLSANSAILDAFENLSAMTALRDVLTHSQCPLVAHLKQVIPAAFAQLHAEDVYTSRERARATPAKAPSLAS